MTPVYMTHELHGVHIAYTEDEIKICESNGWKVREGQSVTAVSPPEPSTAPKKRGRPRKV